MYFFIAAVKCVFLELSFFFLSVYVAQIPFSVVLMVFVVSGKSAHHSKLNFSPSFILSAQRTHKCFLL